MKAKYCSISLMCCFYLVIFKPVVMHMACCILRMSMNEALIGATINAAASLGISSTHGSLEIGKQADLIIVDAPR